MKKQKEINKNYSLRCCPFCGSYPIIKQASWTGVYYVKCSNEKCLVSPTTYDVDKFKKGMTFQQILDFTVKAWNGDFFKS
jgi:hypothetical protein